MSDLPDIEYDDGDEDGSIMKTAVDDAECAVEDDDAVENVSMVTTASDPECAMEDDEEVVNGSVVTTNLDDAKFAESPLMTASTSKRSRTKQQLKQNMDNQTHCESKVKRPRWSELELSKLYKTFGSHISRKESPSTIRAQLNNIIHGKVKCY